ncbi:hypothetical protein QUF63_00510 [Anaerolineales bacterium HSG25]|nr:hypothetical protein [Anaerolineales bacterium HSG25]
MRLIDIKHGIVTVELSPLDCLALFGMSRTACEHTHDGQVDMWQAMRAFFHACAIASYSQWHICSEDEPILDWRFWILD